MKALGLIIAAQAARARLRRMEAVYPFGGCSQLSLGYAQMALLTACRALALHMYESMVSQ